MNKKLLVLTIIILLIIGGAFYYWWRSQKNNLGLKVVESGKLTEEELKSFTDITPRGAFFYSLEQKEEIFNINIFQFWEVNEAKNFFEEISTINEKAAEKIKIQKEQIEIGELSGYIYISNQEPKGCSLILKEEKIVLTLNTANTDEENIKNIIKWFTAKYVKS